MDKLKAEEMIRQQRRRWRSQDTDIAIARRAERAYIGCAMMFVSVAAALSLLFQALPARIVGSAGFILGALVFYCYSRRFTQVRKMLADSQKDRFPSV